MKLKIVLKKGNTLYIKCNFVDVREHSIIYDLKGFNEVQQYSRAREITLDGKLIYKDVEIENIFDK